MTRKPIPLQVARDQLRRINDALSEPQLLIGGLAVQRYVVTRDSQDIDLVCDYETSRKLVRSLYPSDDWHVEEKRDDAHRPIFKIKHLSEDLGEIIFGPKITEREPYAFLDWEYLLNEGKALHLADEEFCNIVIPSCSHLAFSKLLSFMERNPTHIKKRQQDLEDIVDLSNQKEFDPISFLAILRRSRAKEYVRGKFHLNNNEKIIFKKSSFYTLSEIFGNSGMLLGGEQAEEKSPEENSTQEDDHKLRLLKEEVIKIAMRHGEILPTKPLEKDLVIVVDVQQDFFEGGALETKSSASILKPLNQFIKDTEKRESICVFTRDWHPDPHHSFAHWPRHCVKDTPGSAFHSELYIPSNSLVVDIGPSNDSEGYSPFDDIRLLSLIQSTRIRAIFVTGIALEFCVLATCRDAVWFGKPVIAIEPLIAAANEQPKSKQEVWSILSSMGVIVSSVIPQFFA